MKVKVVLERGDDGYYSVHCPALRSCWSQGKTREEALNNIREALELYLEPDPARLTQDDRHEIVELS
jgi:predicted RNase H-like HicB family nuclease